MRTAILLVVARFAALWATSSAFGSLTVPAARHLSSRCSSPFRNGPGMSSTSALGMIFNKNKKEKEDLSYIETRDMTKEEMFALNKQNEDIMNAELAGMTIFSLILSIPMLYLVWVGFFSETAGVVDDVSDALPY